MSSVTLPQASTGAASFGRAVLDASRPVPRRKAPGPRVPMSTMRQRRFCSAPCQKFASGRRTSVSTINGKRGRKALVKVAKEQPASFCKLYALIVPKEMKVEHSQGVKALTDEQLDQAIERGNSIFG